MVFKILGMADLHDQVEMLDSLKGMNFNLIVFCGDLHNGSDKEMARPAAEALAALGPPVLIVPGNMDRKDVIPDLWNEMGLINIDRSSYRYESYGFIGMGGMVVRNPSRLGDPSKYYHMDDEVYKSMASVYPNISSSTWRIVITHQPPRDTRDTIHTGESTGSISLRKFVEEYRPDLLVCGHIHEDRGETQLGSTKIINVGEMRKGHAASIDIGEIIEVSWIES
jgi:uncharacterized protein